MRRQQGGNDGRRSSGAPRWRKGLTNRSRPFAQGGELFADRAGIVGPAALSRRYRNGGGARFGRFGRFARFSRIARSTAGAAPTASALSYGTVTAQVQKGKTTQIDLLQAFSGPNISTTDREGVETWVYERTGRRSPTCRATRSRRSSCATSWACTSARAPCTTCTRRPPSWRASSTASSIGRRLNWALPRCFSHPAPNRRRGQHAGSHRPGPHDALQGAASSDRQRTSTRPKTRPPRTTRVCPPGRARRQVERHRSSPRYARDPRARGARAASLAEQVAGVLAGQGRAGVGFALRWGGDFVTRKNAGFEPRRRFRAESRFYFLSVMDLLHTTVIGCHRLDLSRRASAEGAGLAQPMRRRQSRM